MRDTLEQQTAPSTFSNGSLVEGSSNTNPVIEALSRVELVPARVDERSRYEWDESELEAVYASMDQFKQLTGLSVLLVTPTNRGITNHGEISQTDLMRKAEEVIGSGYAMHVLNEEEHSRFKNLKDRSDLSKDESAELHSLSQKLARGKKMFIKELKDKYSDHSYHMVFFNEDEENGKTEVAACVRYVVTDTGIRGQYPEFNKFFSDALNIVSGKQRRVIGEFGRLSINPNFQFGDAIIRSKVFKEMGILACHIADKHEIKDGDTYIVILETFARGLKSAGIEFDTLNEFILRDNPFVRTMKKLYPNYWARDFAKYGPKVRRVFIERLAL